MLYEIISTVLFGLALIYFSDQIAGLFVSSSIVRGADNPWTYKVLGFLAIAYGLFSLLLFTYLM